MAPARTSLQPLLLATEHTEQDRGAEAAAFAWARTLAPPPAGAGDAARPLLPVVMPLLSNPEYETVAPHLAERAEADAAARRRALEADAAAAGVALDVQVRRGSEPHLEIVAAAEEAGSALLVIRRRGKRGLLANLLIGEMVSRVLEESPCSVAVVPRDAPPWRHGVLVAVDPERPAAAQTPLLAQAHDIAQAAGMPLHLVCVAARERERAGAEAVLHQLQSGWQPAPASSEVRVGSAHAELIAAAQARGADLIALARHGSGALRRARAGGVGSVAQKVIGLATCAVLVQVTPAPR